MIITLEHARSIPCDGRHGYCAQGMRAFAERHGLDWGRFLREGLPEEEFLATHDAMALRLVSFARRLTPSGVEGVAGDREDGP